MESIFETKARENIRAADILFEHGMYNASANRAYYAAFHAAVSAFAKAGIQLAKLDHDKVQAQFSGELIRRKKLYPCRLKSHLLDLQAIRNIADYRPRAVFKKMARRQLDRATEYLQALQQEN